MRYEFQTSVLGPAKIRTIRENDDGSGVIEIPLLSAGQTIRSKFTSGGGDGELQVTGEVLRQMALNFAAWGRPVPFGFDGHVPFGERSGPSPANVEAMRVDGDRLMVTLSVVAPFFADVKRGLWRGVSAEIVKDLEFVTGTFDGWLVYGGTFTNRPAAEGAFFVPEQMAAGAVVALSLEIAGDTSASEGDIVMTDDPKTPAAAAAAPPAESTPKASGSVESLRRDVNTLHATLETQLESVTKDRDELRIERNELQSKLDLATNELRTQKSRVTEEESRVRSLKATVKTLEGRITDLSEERDDARRQSNETEALQIAKEAMDNHNVPAAVFEGIDKDFQGYLDSEFEGSMNMFRKHVATLTGLDFKGPGPKGKTQPSGHDPAKAGDDAPKRATLSAEDQTKYDRMAKNLGLKVDFGAASTQEEAQAILEAAEAGGQE